MGLYMIGSFASGANASLVAKNGTKKIIPLLLIKLSKKPQIKKFHKTDPPKSGNSDSKYNFEICKNQKSNSKKTKKPKNDQKKKMTKKPKITKKQKLPKKK